MNTDFPVFVISLKSDTERRRKIASLFAEYGISYQFWDATDYRSDEFNIRIRDIQPKQNSSYGEMTLPEKACALSHLSIYQHILDNNIDWALVLEDDVTFDRRLADVLRELSSRQDCLKQHSTYVLGGQQGTSEYQLFGLSLRHTQVIGNVRFRRATYKKHKVTRACSYIVDRIYCQRALELFESHGFFLVDDRKILFTHNVMKYLYFSDVVTHPLVNINNSHLEKSRCDIRKNNDDKKVSKFKKSLRLWRYKLRVMLGSFE